ncbi:MAG: hypothetical protein J6Y69_06670 [Treponema sp.]|nr:hypothetical protein [Treponema sp.]
MTNQTLGELLLLLLLGISCARIFFTRQAHLDPLSVLPLITLVLCLIFQVAFEITAMNILITGIAFFNFIWNIRALIRLHHKLVVDHYGILFIIVSIVNLIAVIVISVFVIIYRPAKINTKTFAVKTSQQRYCLKEAGYVECESPLDYATLIVNKYTGESNGGKSILLIPGALSSSSMYEPFCVKLARDGYTVYCAQLFGTEAVWFGDLRDSRFLRRFCMMYSQNNNAEEYEDALKHKDEYYTKVSSALFPIISADSSDKFYIVTDGADLTSGALLSNMAGNKTACDGIFDLATIPTYSTPEYGPIEQTYPLLAKNIFDIERDGTFYMSSHIATVLERSIEQSIIDSMNTPHANN